MGAGGAAEVEQKAAGQAATGKVRLVGHANFVRTQQRSDKFAVHKFHHIEFWTGDATNAYKRFQHGLGMTLVAKSDQSTGNQLYASYVLRSNDLVFTFTAPYSRKCCSVSEGTPMKHYSPDQAYEFVNSHGLAVRAIGLLVDDACAAYQAAMDSGGTGVLAPLTLTGGPSGASQVVSEVKLYGDVVLRFVSGGFAGAFMAGYQPVVDAPAISYGIRRLDHAVGNVHVLVEALERIMGFTGFHEFAEFVSEDVGTVDSGLNSMVLANDTETVLLPINEPTFGTPRKSQIQTYLEQNEGPGLQHLALMTDNIFATLRQMRARSECGGFEFMPRASDKYYRNLPAKIGDALSPEQYAEVEALGILVDRDDQGVLLQIFTRPLSDRPTVFIEIIQRVGCMRPVNSAADAADTVPGASSSAPAAASGSVAAARAAVSAAGAAVSAAANAAVTSAKASMSAKMCEAASSASAAITEAVGGATSAPTVPAVKATLHGPQYEQAAGCGGFGKGNFTELFKSIEDYERTLNV